MKKSLYLFLLTLLVSPFLHSMIESDSHSLTDAEEAAIAEYFTSIGGIQSSAYKLYGGRRANTPQSTKKTVQQTEEPKKELPEAVKRAQEEEQKAQVKKECLRLEQENIKRQKEEELLKEEESKKLQQELLRQKEEAALKEKLQQDLRQEVSPHASIVDWKPGSYGNYPGFAEKKPPLPTWVYIRFHNELDDKFISNYFQHLKQFPALKNIKSTHIHRGPNVGTYTFTIDSKVTKDELELLIKQTNSFFEVKQHKFEQKKKKINW